MLQTMRGVGLFVMLAFSLGCGQRFSGPRTDGAPVTAAPQALANGSMASNSGVYYLPLSNQDPLRYRWQVGQTYVYNVKIEVEDDDVTETMQGNSYYNVLPMSKVNRPQVVAGDKKPTASAFVIHPDGFLLTCAHVAQKASILQVALNGKTYPAQIMAISDEQDLALLKIEATNLPFLALANSENVELGEDVRAVGYPMSSVLGDSIKATRGTISGIEQKDGSKVFQVDASINPGNSGGPLINEKGDVVGVTHAKLAGDDVTNVGFAVPINYAKKLLSGQMLRHTPGTATQRLEGPALIKKVSPTVALVTITPKTGDAEGDIYNLRHSGQLMSSKKNKNGIPAPGGIGRLGMFSPFGGVGLPRFPNHTDLRVDGFGRVVDAKGGNSQLPYVLGNLSLLVLEPLSAEGRRRWEVTDRIAIEEKGDDRPGFGPGNFPRPPFGPRMPRPGFPGAPEPKGKTYEGLEKTVYSLGERNGDTVSIKKQYEMKTQEAGAKQPHLQLVGEGTFVFDTNQGLPKSLDFQVTLNVSEGNVTARLPIHIEYRLLEGDERAKALQPPPANPNQAGQAVAPAKPDPKPITDAEITQALTDLKGADLFKQRRAAEQLAQAALDNKRQEEVAKTLESLLTTQDLFTRKAVAQALGVWGGKDSVPALLKILDEDSSPFVKWDAMAALGKLKDDRSFDKLVEQLAVDQNRAHASQALQAVGSGAEKAVHKALKHENLWVRTEACKVLKVIGTKASVESLETAAKDMHPFVSGAAQEALKAIQKTP